MYYTIYTPKIILRTLVYACSVETFKRALNSHFVSDVSGVERRNESFPHAVKERRMLRRHPLVCLRTEQPAACREAERERLLYIFDEYCTFLNEYHCLLQDKLLTKLEENEPELATSQEDECVICVNAKATMQTSPCGHRVVCRKCFVKTIQMAVSQRLLPLRCVICRAKILRLKQQHCGGGGGAGGGSGAGGHHAHHAHAHAHHAHHGLLPASASQYSVGAASVPASASLYSMSSGASSLSGVSSVSSATSASGVSARSTKSASAASTVGSGRLGFPRQPTGSLRRSQAQAMKVSAPAPAPAT
ncbi:Uncharacterized protein GBIM_10456, partial [Gryllus bimaculatus]